jgi:hypothetical protein
MKINNGPQAHGIVLEIGTAKPRLPHKARAADVVELSGPAHTASARAARVDQLQSAINAGTYHVSPAEIAKSLIAEATSQDGATNYRIAVTRVTLRRGKSSGAEPQTKGVGRTCLKYAL